MFFSLKYYLHFKFLYNEQSSPYFTFLSEIIPYVVASMTKTALLSEIQKLLEDFQRNGDRR